MNLIRQDRCRNRKTNPQSGKIKPEVSYALVAMLFGIAVFFALRTPEQREAFAWDKVRHWLAVVGLGAGILLALLVLITLVVFACNTDWQTREGFMGLLFCVLLEVVVVAGLVGVVLIIAIVTQLGH